MPNYYAKGNKRGKRAYNVYMSTSQTAQKALALATAIAGKINVEFGYFDLTSSVSPANTGAVLHLTQMAQGDGASNRHGEQCKIKSLSAKFYGSQHADGVNTVMRCIWFIDTQQDGTNPTPAELLEDIQIHSHMNFDNRKRFVVLKDMVINLGDNTAFDGTWFKKLSLTVDWDGTTGTTGMKNNHLYFYYMSNEATNTPTLNIEHRLRYLDN